MDISRDMSASGHMSRISIGVSGGSMSWGGRMKIRSYNSLVEHLAGVRYWVPYPAQEAVGEGEKDQREEGGKDGIIFWCLS